MFFVILTNHKKIKPNTQRPPLLTIQLTLTVINVEYTAIIVNTFFPARLFTHQLTNNLKSSVFHKTILTYLYPYAACKNVACLILYNHRKLQLIIFGISL